MKWMIASDVHGSAHYCDLMLKAYEKESAQGLILLGDLLYHGPRNDLPRNYNPKAVLTMLNDFSQRPDVRLFCVRGNCDAEVDQMVLNFPIMATYAVLSAGRRLIFLTHGHVLSEQNPPKLSCGDILLQGHTHIPTCSLKSDIYYLNPGSVSIPKNNTWHGYMIMETSQTTLKIKWADLEGQDVALKPLELTI
jgi:uncharacterized protein